MSAPHLQPTPPQPTPPQSGRRTQTGTDLPQDPAGVHALVWPLFARGVDDRRCGFHQPTLATVGEDGSPHARLVVLRRADPEALLLYCHTDVRARKLREIARRPRVCFLFYDARSKIQARVDADAEVHHADAVARDGWDRLRSFSKRCYLAPYPPGAEVDEPHPNLPDHLRDRSPDHTEAEPGYEQFAVIVARVRSIDYLHLEATGHHRALLRYAADGAISATWLTP